MLRIGIVAGEASGDMLGAGLVDALSKTVPDLSIEGIGGERLIAIGMNVLYPLATLSVMGITEVLSRYRQLKTIRTALRDHFIKNPPDVFIGIDVPDFNLWLETELRAAGIKTVHYVSPSVWAWRQYRIKKIARAVDLVLNLFPFESKIYDQYGIPNHYVGHPLADQLEIMPDQITVRNQLGLPLDKTIIAILPGSRLHEIDKIAPPLIQAAEIVARSEQRLMFVSSFVNDESLARFNNIQTRLAVNINIDLHVAKTHLVMAAADVIMLASGTATLEAMLLKKPMIVAYRLSWLSHLIIKCLANIPYAALPNILAGEEIVQEYLQSDCTPQKLADGLQKILNAKADNVVLQDRYSVLSNQLRKNANQQAAQAVLKLIGIQKHA